jgi:hypothetical protein
MLLNRSTEITRGAVANPTGEDAVGLLIVL